MDVTSARYGCKCKNDLSNSSASATIHGEFSGGNNKLLPKFLEIPPKNAPHPVFDWLKIVAVIVLTVVFPCVPETAIQLFPLQIIPRALARFISQMGFSLH